MVKESRSEEETFSQTRSKGHCRRRRQCPCVLVSWSCCNNHKLGVAKNERNIFLPSSGGHSPKSRCQPVWFLLGTLRVDLVHAPLLAPGGSQPSLRCQGLYSDRILHSLSVSSHLRDCSSTRVSVSQASLYLSLMRKLSLDLGNVLNSGSMHLRVLITPAQFNPLP